MGPAPTGCALAVDLADLGSVADLLATGDRREANREIDRLQRAVDLLGLVEIDVAAAVEAAR